jgi:hypothetical protein
MHVLYMTTTYDGGHFELFVPLSLSLPDDSRFCFLHFKGSVLEVGVSTGEVGDVSSDDAEESESKSESNELDNSMVIDRRWTIMLKNGSKSTLESKIRAGGHEILQYLESPDILEVKGYSIHIVSTPRSAYAIRR